MKKDITSSAKKILLIDDDPNLRLLFKDYLSFQGYGVITASNGREALMILETNTPDLIICDVMMPELDGYGFLAEVRLRTDVGWIPVLFLSAARQSHDQVKGLNSGADVYMVKPIEPEELLAQVKSSLEMSDRIYQHRIQQLDRVTPLEVVIKVHPMVTLTATETKVIQFVALGLINKDIAECLGVSKRTIESHLFNMLNKTGLENRTELARWAIESGMVESLGQ